MQKIKGEPIKVWKVSKREVRGTLFSILMIILVVLMMLSKAPLERWETSDELILTASLLCLTIPYIAGAIYLAMSIFVLEMRAYENGLWFRTGFRQCFVRWENLQRSDFKPEVREFEGRSDAVLLFRPQKFQELTLWGGAGWFFRLLRLSPKISLTPFFGVSMIFQTFKTDFGIVMQEYASHLFVFEESNIRIIYDDET